MRPHLALLGLAVAGFCCCGSTAEPPAGAVAALIAQAGNAREDRVRFELLRELRQRPDLPATMAADLDRLLPIAEQYAALKRFTTEPGDGVRGAENGYLCFFYLPIRRTKDTPADDFPPRIDPASPLYPLHCLYRGRMLIWYPIQRGSIAQNPAQRGPWFDEGRRLLAIARQAFPDNPVIGMYLGTPIPWPRRIEPDPRAPEWANLQRSGLEKWADVVEWWIDHRQLPNGEFGGGWGDDVELWRTWPAVLVAFQEPKIEAAQERISAGIFRLPHLQAGFMAKPFDAEHSSEDTADSLTPMMLIRPDDPVWGRRTLRLAELMRDVWMGVNARGRLQFKSSWIGAGGVDLTGGRASDTAYHFRTMQPTLLYWLRTGDPALTALFTRWIDTWVDATARAENGKPAGIPPASLRWPDGVAGGHGDRWWKAGFYDTGLYDFPGAIDEMLPHFLLAYHLTGERRFAEPVAALARLLRRQRQGELGEGKPGSLPWSVRAAGRAVLGVLPKYRTLTGDTAFDDLIREGGSAYAAYRLDGDTARLERALRETATALATNFEAYTSEVRWTDRIQAFHGKYLNLYTAERRPGLALDLLYTMASGDLGSPRFFPMNAVRWLTPPREIAALVTAASPERFSARLFHFGAEPRLLEAELYGLKPGRYRLTVATAAEHGVATEWSALTIEIAGPRTRVALRLPARQLCEVKVAP